jgi:hypothetical protein
MESGGVYALFVTLGLAACTDQVHILSSSCTGEDSLYRGHFRSCMVTAPCSASYCLNLNRLCGVSVSIGAVTKVHCLCDVICCLTVDQERLQGSLS